MVQLKSRKAKQKQHVLSSVHYSVYIMGDRYLRMSEIALMMTGWAQMLGSNMRGEPQRIFSTFNYHQKPPLLTCFYMITMEWDSNDQRNDNNDAT